MNVAVVGTGYVGLVAGICFADAGHHVWGVDRDENKISALNRQEIPIYEPGLSDIFKRAQSRLIFTTNLADAVKNCDVIFIAVGTPETADGSADLSPTMAVVESVAKYAESPKFLVLKSTVPIGTAKQARELLQKNSKTKIEVISNPEFLKEGAAIEDFLKPDRVVIGCQSSEAQTVMQELYEPFLRNGHPILFMDNVAAEMTKYAANAFLSVKISFINELALLADELGADIDDVKRGFTSDKRINPAFFYPGVGFGGSCFPKDVRALIHSGQKVGVPMQVVEASDLVNDRQKTILFDRIRDYFNSRGESLKGKKIALWGLAFKPKTDDVREAPARYLIEKLVDAGAMVSAFDPVAMKTAKASFNCPFTPTETAYQATEGADALAIVTEWNEFRTIDLETLKRNLKTPVIFDGRNILDPTRVSESGFDYFSIGKQVLSSKAEVLKKNKMRTAGPFPCKTALVAGAAGFVGSHLVDTLLEQGYHVIGVDNLVTGQEANLKDARQNPHFQFIQHDISHPLRKALKAHGVSYQRNPLHEIYNLASPASPIDFDKIPLEILETAARGQREVLDLAHETGATCLFTSSSEVYGDAEVHPQVESYFGNVNPIGHRSCYDEAKRYGEALTVAHSRALGTKVRIARIFNTYGPRMRPTDGRIIPNFFIQALQNQPLTIYGDGTQTRSFCFVNDMVLGLIALMRSEETRPTNLGNPIERSVKEIAETIIALTKSHSKMTHLPLPENDPKLRKPNISRASGFGWAPRVSLEEGLNKSEIYFRRCLESSRDMIRTPTISL